MAKLTGEGVIIGAGEGKQCPSLVEVLEAGDNRYALPGGHDGSESQLKLRAEQPTDVTG